VHRARIGMRNLDLAIWNMPAAPLKVLDGRTVQGTVGLNTEDGPKTILSRRNYDSPLAATKIDESIAAGVDPRLAHNSLKNRRVGRFVIARVGTQFAGHFGEIISLNAPFSFNAISTIEEESGSRFAIEEQAVHNRLPHQNRHGAANITIEIALGRIFHA
jgi:hypothetical protein